MPKLNLKNVTLLGIDCVNVERLIVAMDVTESGIEFGAVKLLTSLLTEDKRKVSIPHIASIEEFSRFCIEDLCKYVDTDYVLLIQYDGFVLNPESWTDEFLKYDYIGAPWNVGSWETNSFPKELYGTWVTGNGGFSLRSKKFLEISSKLIKDGIIKEFHPEDISLCVWNKNHLEKERIKFAPAELGHKFSIESKVEVYGKPFGFHGAYGENLDEMNAKWPDFPMYIFFSRVLKKRIEIIKRVFKEYAVEMHLLGSFVRGNADDFSDIDIWITIKDEDFSYDMEKRFELFNQVGEVIHVCEPPQNAPVNGIFSTVIYKAKIGIFVVDYYFCPKSTAFITNESKNIFGEIDLPKGELSLNPQKVVVDENYRIDFFICFIFNSIKKIVRKNINPLEAVLKEYRYLKDRYNIQIKELINTDQNFEMLLEILENTKEFADDKQKLSLNQIEDYMNIVYKNFKSLNYK